MPLTNTKLRIIGIVFVAIAAATYGIPEPNAYNPPPYVPMYPGLANVLSVLFFTLLGAGLLLIFFSYYSRVGRKKLAAP